MIDKDRVIIIKNEMENEIKYVNKIIFDKLNNESINCSLDELENLFYINDINYFSSVMFDVVNHQYQFGDDYSMYDEPTSVEEKRLYDEAVNQIETKLVGIFKENYPLLQIKKSKIYVKDF